MGLFSKWFESGSGEKKNPRLRMSHIKPGDKIIIENSELFSFADSLGHCICITNDLETRNILIKINWNGDGPKRYILPHHSYAFRNLHLLNPDHNGPTPAPKVVYISQISDVSVLKNKMAAAIKKEQYEKAMSIRDRLMTIKDEINTLLKEEDNGKVCKG